MDLRSRLRPMGVGDIIDETFRLYRENFTLFLATCAVLEVPAQIISILLMVNAGPLPRLNTSSGTISSDQLNNYLSRIGSYSAGTGIGSLIVLLVSLFITAALAVVISNRYLNRPVTVGDAYRAAMNRLGSLIGAILWVAVRIIGLVLLFIIAIFVLVSVNLGPLSILLGLALVPVIVYLAISWSLISPVIMLENVGGVAASKRSRELIRGYWWKAFGLFLVTGILVAILSSIPNLVIGGLAGTGNILLSSVLGAVVTLLLRPIQTGVSILLFYDLKIRKEAFDLEAMVQQIGGATPTSYTPPPTTDQ